MVAVHTFVIHIKYCIKKNKLYMTEKKIEKKTIHSSKGEMGLGAIFLLLLLGVFILWVLTGSKNDTNSNNYFVQPQQIDQNFPN